MANASRAGVAHSQHRRPGSRIVPAIPYRLSKAQPSARPITPEESTKGTAVPPTELPPDQQHHQQEGQSPQQEQHDQQDDELSQKHQQAAMADVPLTPESRASADDETKNDAHAPASTSFTAKLPDQQRPPARASGGYPTRNAASNHVNGHAAAKARTPTNARDEAKPAANGAHRKLTIPTYLPPPFVPSSKAGTPTPPVDGRDAPHAALPRPPPGFAPQQFAPFFPGPAQYPPEAGAPWHLPPHTPAPPEAAFQKSADYRPSPFPNGPAPYAAPYNGHFSPREASLAANGTPTSLSQSPTKAQFESMPVNEHPEDQSAAPVHQDGAAPPEERVESSFELAGYLSSQFGNPELADFVLQIRSPDSMLLSLPIHGIVVMRSPVIAEAIHCSPAPTHRSRDTRPVIHVLALDPLATRDSLEEAIRVLYGAPLIRAQGFLYGLPSSMYDNQQTSPSPEARRRMQQVLGYIAAARTLQIPSMQARGVDTARLLLRWDTVELVLQYALQASSRFRPRREVADVDDPFITALISCALDFVAFAFPFNFKLHAIAPELKDAPRLPTLLESRQPAHNPRLSKIRFGDAPPEDELQPSYPTLVLSTILLSLPPPLIERLFNQLATTNRIGWKEVAKHLRDVVGERENRRQKALQGHFNQIVDGSTPAALFNNVYVEEGLEQVEPSPLHPSGYRLTTKRVGSEA
ncbi:uncharacterized protein SETTUDRAFT_95523 [Exserohilum turcica Et28A]|uniref:Uncharacterized protein n=1 Tax=Exserohilum turcicum (strain 28A) TaxID=671987 RepID=R0ICU7_EXST2|nr:uncharacterized protein SETTUDRAFT_95523 [Exserohilum turcica Et28A]EOA83016.1 hypothetical protein SETTUDRAFT_95523 [Exserohilum turcica Et28A]